VKKTAFILISLLLSGCANKNYTLMQTPDQTVEASDARYYNIDYKIQPMDRLAIISYNHKDLMPVSINDKGILLDSHGDASLPLIHRVHLAGLTQNQAAHKLERLYSKYLKNPSFNVEALNKKIYVLGEVRKPGVVNMDKDQITILEALASAGDLSDNAVRNNIIVLSRDAVGHMRMRKIDLTNFNAMKATNLMLKPNDIVYVQPNNWKQVKVTADNLGAVTKVISNVAAPYLIFK